MAHPDKEVVLVFDCGATNVRVIAIDIDGEIHASHSFPNNTNPDPFNNNYLIWDINEIWKKLCKASKVVTNEIELDKILGVTVTTFGVDGTFVNKNGELLYPIISWQCNRTAPIMEQINNYIPLNDLYKISGVAPYSFNTLNKLIWFKENQPDVFKEADAFLFMPSLIAYLLSGTKATDATMLGTSMLANIRTRDISKPILDSIDIPARLFPKMIEAGNIIGKTTTEASKMTGIPKNMPICSAGHDTQFAIFGSGADISQVVLSSGTWEILMSRSKFCQTSKNELSDHLTNELDAIPGVYNTGQNYLAGGILEIVAQECYPNLRGNELYKTMIKEAINAEASSQGIFLKLSPYETELKTISKLIKDLKTNYPPGVIVKLIYENLAFRLRLALETLQKAGNFKATSIICVGGGSKNQLLNQLRADVTGVPVYLIKQKETTVLGASMFAFFALNKVNSPDELRIKLGKPEKEIVPSDQSVKYLQYYEQYQKQIRHTHRE